MISNQFTTFLFDFEGTLVDFQWNLKAATDEAREELAHWALDPALLAEGNYAIIRNKAVLAAARLGLNPQEVANSVGAIYDRYDRDALSRWSLLPGVQDLLLDLKQTATVGLVSNVGRRAIDKALTKLGLAGLFDVVVTRNDVALLKPSGEGIRLALERLAAQSHSTLFIGDSVADILAAQEAGIAVAIVQGGESDPAALLAARPTYLLQGLAELRQL